jgi:chromosome segregation ATPase
LKEATKTRDEDIRKSLRDLVGNFNEQTARINSRESYSGLYLDNKPHNTSPSATRQIQLPRIPSPKSFSESIDLKSFGASPPAPTEDAAASTSLLESIIRDMGTKEGQQSLLIRLNELSEKLSGMATATKVDELAHYVRTQADNAIVLGGPGGNSDRNRNLSFDRDSHAMELELGGARSGAVDARRSSAPTGRGSELVNEDLMKIIKSVKDSVAQGGGLTAEVKALVRELRGEVLGMGREIGKRLEQVGQKAIEEPESASKDEVSRIIDEGLEQMKDQLNHVLREHRRQSAASASSQKTAVDYQEIYNAMRAALRDNEASHGNMPDLSRDDVIEAVREAWENYKPEIEVQQLGLERDEVLECLKEGLREYAPRDTRPAGATREEVFKAVIEGFKHFVPPRVETPASMSRDEIIEAVRDCLEEFEFPVAASAVGTDLTRSDMVHAVREGLSELDLPRTEDLIAHSSNGEIVSRLQDLMEYIKLEFKAVSEEAKENVAANGRDTEQVLDATKDGLENLRIAIEGYVDRAAGVAGTQEFMESLWKSFEEFKEDIGSLISHSSNSSREQLQTELDGLRDVVHSSMVPATPSTNSNNKEVLEALHSGLNSLRQEILRPRTETGEILDALNDGLNDLRAGIDRIGHKPVDLTANDEILDALKEGLDSVKSDIEALRDSSGDRALATIAPAAPTPNDEILDALRAGLDSVRSDIEALREETGERVVAAVAPAANDELLQALKSGLDSVKSDIEALRDSSNDRAMATVGPTVNDELLEALKAGLDSVKSDIEALRDSSSDRAMAAVAPSSNEELLDALRSGLDSVKSDIEALRESTNERTMAAVVPSTNDELLDALKSGLDSVKSDIEALRDSSNEKAMAAVAPAVNDEILEAIKSGLDSVRSDIGELRDNNDRAVAAVNNSDMDQAIIPADMLKHDDIKNLEVLITQMRIKVEAMEPEAETVQKDDLVRLEEMVRNVQQGVEEISTSVPKAAAADAEPASTDAASREDVQAIETILRNTKSRLDDLIDGDQAVRKEHVDTIETLLLETKESMGTVTGQLDTISRKEDLSSIESLIAQLSLGLDEIKEQTSKAPENPENVTKTDVEAVETVVLEIKTALDALTSTHFSNLPSKDDLTLLEAAFREAQEKNDANAEASVKALDERQAEIVGVGERVSEVKTFLEEFQEAVKGKLEEGTTGVESVGKLLETMSEKIDKNENIQQDLKEMFDTMKAEFEDSKAIVAGAKLESDEKLQLATDSLGTKIEDKISELITKYDEFQTLLDEKNKAGEARDIETEAAVVGTKAVADELKLLIDTLGSTVTDSLEKMEEASKTVFSRVEDLVTRTDENHTDHKTEHQQTRDQVQQALSMVEGMQGDMKDFQPKILEALKDVLLLVGEHFEHSKNSVTDIQDKIIEAKPIEQPLLPAPEKYDDSEVREQLKYIADQKYDDSEIRERLDKLVELKYDDSEVQEKLNQLVSLKYDDSEVREKLNQLVEQKYDDSEVREKLSQLIEQKYDDSEVREKLNQLVEQKYDDSEVREKLTLLLEQKYDDSDVKERLDLLAIQKYDDSEVRERLDTLIEAKYDDASVHEKLDKLVDQGNAQEQALSQLETLDKVHKSVVATAAEISSFLSVQTQRIADDHEDREKTLQDTIIALERKLAERDHVEAAVRSLRDEEERLRSSVINLRTEQESLIRQKTRLTGDVSSLQTALHLRKEELCDMESRAEALERRILEGVMDHSRVLLMSKSMKSADAMSRKRVKKPSMTGEPQAARSLQPAVNIALSAKRNLAAPMQTGRRIVSLSQINNNAATGGVKRSQSVRTPNGQAKGLRKRSWGGDVVKGFGVEDKENMRMSETVEEVDEPETPAPEDHDTAPFPGDEGSNVTTAVETDSNVSTAVEGEDDSQSDTGTLRRESIGTTVISGSTGQYTESEGYSDYYDDDDYTGSEWTESAVGTRSSLGTDAGPPPSEVEVEGNEVVVYGR